jgi:hypothetical protein
MRVNTNVEKELASKGQCIWQTGYGLPWTTYCGKKAKRDHLCAEHLKDEQDLYAPKIKREREQRRVR